MKPITLILIFALITTSAHASYSGTEGDYRIDFDIYAHGVGGAYNEGGYSLYLVPEQASISYLCGITLNDPPCNKVPVASAGYDQTVHAGSVATLDGSGSSDPDGNVPLSYGWNIISKPDGSTASLLDSSAVNPTLIPDIGGDYVIQLVVKDSLAAASLPDTVKISTTNSAPIAASGPDQSIILVGTTVKLDGSQSYDADGDIITYQWAFVSLPTGSAATLNGANTAAPTFVADVYGEYVVQLVVSDLSTQSFPDTVTVSFENLKPEANAGTSKSVALGDTVFLDGSSSSDANGDTLSYKWILASSPQGSLSVIGDPTSMITTFVPDLPGTYIVQLIVDDGLLNSDPSPIQVQVVNSKTNVVEKIQNLEKEITLLDPNTFKNTNMQNTLINKLNGVIENIEGGNYQGALEQLENDISGKTNGCVNTGAPDKNDWIKNCGSQDIIYPHLLEIIQKVKMLS